MKINASQLRNSNIGQPVTLENRGVSGILWAIHDDGSVDVGLGHYDLEPSEPVDIFRDPVMGHLFRKEKESEERGGVDLSDEDLDDIEDLINTALASRLEPLLARLTEALSLGGQEVKGVAA